MGALSNVPHSSIYAFPATLSNNMLGHIHGVANEHSHINYVLLHEPPCNTEPSLKSLMRIILPQVCIVLEAVLLNTHECSPLATQSSLQGRCSPEINLEPT